jgi:hypothetical protein
MERTTSSPARQRKPRPKPERTVRLAVEPTAEKSGVFIITVGKETFPCFVDEISADYGRAFCLSKFDGTSYDVNLGDEQHPQSCECKGHLRWGHRTVCKYLAGLKALVEAGRL